MRVLLTLLLAFSINLVFADDHEYENDNIFAPWNDPLQKDDIFAPWNNPIAGEDDTNEYMRDNGVDEESYYWD